MHSMLPRARHVRIGARSEAGHQTLLRRDAHTLGAHAGRPPPGPLARNDPWSRDEPLRVRHHVSGTGHQACHLACRYLESVETGTGVAGLRAPIYPPPR